MRLHTSQVGSLGNDWITCALLQFFGHQSFAQKCAEGRSAGGGLSTSAGDTSVELEDILVNPSVNGCGHSGNSVSICSSWSPSARVCFRSHRARSGDRLLARLGQPKESGYQLWYRCFSHSWWDTMAVLDASHTSNNFTSHKLSNETTSILSIVEFNLNKSVHKTQTQNVASCVEWIVQFAVIITDGSFDSETVSCFYWSQITMSHHMKWTSRFNSDFSPFRRRCRKWRNIAPRDLFWRTCFDPRSTNLELCARSCVKTKQLSLLFLSMLKVVR